VGSEMCIIDMLIHLLAFTCAEIKGVAPLHDEAEGTDPGLISIDRGDVENRVGFDKFQSSLHKNLLKNFSLTSMPQDEQAPRQTQDIRVLQPQDGVRLLS